jgi:hypothetical protein
MGKMSEQKKRRETPLVVWLVLGNLIAYAVCSAVMGEFAKRAKTEDWILEYSTWVRWGFWVVYFLIVGVFVLFGVALRRGQKKESDLV